MDSLCWNPACVNPPPDPGQSICSACQFPLVLHDRYRAQGELGKNAFSRTLLAVDLLQDRQVVVKQWEMTPEAMARSKLLQKLPPHPAIPALQSSFSALGWGYWVYPYLKGMNLTQHRQQGAFSESQVWQMMEEILPALHFLHSYHLIHGDINPRNILWHDSHYYLVDLGLLTGDPGYAAPEQLQGHAAYASDIYSLGMVALYVLWGTSPFQLQELWELHRSTLQDIQGKAILDRMINPSLGSRFSSVASLTQEIRLRKAMPIPLPDYPAAPSWSLYAPISPPETFLSSILAIALHPDRGVWVVSRARKVLELRQWDSPIVIERPCPYPIKTLTSNEQYLLGGDSQGSIHRWDWADLSIRHSFVASQSAIRALALSPDGQILASGGAGKTIELWETDRGKPIASLVDYPPSAHCLRFSPNGKYLASGMIDNRVGVWDWQRGIPLHRLRGHTWAVLALDFNPTGSLLASGGIDGSIRLWDMATGTSVQVLSGHSWRVTTLAFCADGAELISGSWDGTWKRWEVSTGKPMEAGPARGHGITALSLNREQNRMVSGTKDGSIYLWSKER